MIVRLALHAMGTRFEFVLGGENEAYLRAVGEEALDEIRRLEEQLSPFRRDSVVADLERRACRERVRVEPEVFALLELCRAIWRASGGAFDPTVAALMRAWGFRGADRPEVAGAELAQVRASVGMEHVDLDRPSLTVRFERPGLQLDLGAIGKGWALDAARAVLADADLECALIHGGTSGVVALGRPPDQPAWRVAVRAPGSAAKVLASVHLANLALGVSAPHGRVAGTREGEFGHVMDPRTGRPVRGARLALVVDESAARADAWSTALLVQGGDGSLEIDPQAGSITGLVLGSGETPDDLRIFGPLADHIDTSPGSGLADQDEEDHP